MWRKEKDSLGTKKIPNDVVRWIYTERVLDVYPQSFWPRVPESLLRSYLELKMIYATVNARFRKISQEEKRSIHAVIKKLLKLKADDFMKYFPIWQIQSGWGTSTNMMVNEVVANLASEYLWGKYGDGKVNTHNVVNASQSSNDTFPWASKVSLYFLTDSLLEALQKSIVACRKHARRWKSLRKVWRTHLQDAVVITLWDEFSWYARSLEKSKKYLLESQKILLELPLWGTALWTLQNISTWIRKEIVKEYTEFYQIPFYGAKNYFEQNSSSSDFSYYSQQLVLLANNLIKIWNDLRLLSSGPFAWIWELILPSVQPGSSIMPGKINPSIVEALTMSCAHVIWQNETVQVLTRQAQLDLQQFHPWISFALHTSLETLTWSLYMFEKHCLNSLECNKDHIKKTLEKSFAYATDYAEDLWYNAVALLVKKALKEKINLQELLEKALRKKK